MRRAGAVVLRSTTLRLQEVIAPLAHTLGTPTKRRLEAALGVVIGIESVVVLRDVFGLNDEDTEDVLRWMCKAMARAAIKEERTSHRTPRPK
jgi:hypothetical protein